MGLAGIWWGVFVAGVIKVIGEMFVVRYTNWAEEAERAVKRVRNTRAGKGAGAAPRVRGSESERQ